MELDPHLRLCSQALLSGGLCWAVGAAILASFWVVACKGVRRSALTLVFLHQKRWPVFAIVRGVGCLLVNPPVSIGGFFAVVALTAATCCQARLPLAGQRSLKRKQVIYEMCLLFF